MPPRAQKVSKKQGDKDKRYLIGLRLGHDARVRLEKAAAESGRSLAAEAEARLEWSFRSSENPEAGPLQLKFGRFFGVMLAAGLAADRVARLEVMAKAHEDWKNDKLIESTVDLEGWVDDPAAYEKAMAAVEEVMKTFRPAGDRDDRLSPDAPHRVANMLFSDLPATPRLAYVRSALGNLINRLPTAATGPHSPQDPE